MSDKIVFGEWCYLRIEPNMGSGEYINAGIFLKDNLGVIYEAILDHGKCVFTFGPNGNYLYSMVDQIVAKISVEGSFNIDIGISGISLSLPKIACYENQTTFLKDLKKNSIFSSAGYELLISRYMKTIKRERELEHFVQSVKEKMTSIAKNYGNYFDIKYAIPNTNYDIKYGFSTGRYISNFAYIKACQNLTGMVKSTIYKMVDLSILQSSAHENKPEEYEIILYRPQLKIASSRLEERYITENNKIATFAKENGIHIFDAAAGKYTVDHLIRKIAS